MAKFNYKKDIDVLLVEEDDYSEFDRSLELGGIVLDLDNENEFLGVEIIDASQKTPLSKQDLENIEDVEIDFFRDDEIIRVKLVLTVGGRKNSITSQYPSEVLA